MVRTNNIDFEDFDEILVQRLKDLKQTIHTNLLNIY